MNKPNYKNSSTLNLISSVSQALGHKSTYKSLKILNPKELKSSKNIVLLLIDGLGYEFLKKYGKDTEFNKNMKGKITTVFPSTTAAATTSLMTGLSPLEHGMTAWFVFAKEFGEVIVPLPYISRIDKTNLSERTNIKNMFNIKPFMDKLKAQSYLVQYKKILNTDFTKTAVGKTKRVGFSTMNSYFNQIKKVIKSNNKRKFIFAYYPEHDKLCHEFGTKHKKTQTHFKELSKKLASFLKSIEGTNTTLLITADHGMVDIEKSKRIHIEKHPKLEETLSLFLCAERRFAYCYVKPSKEKQFLNYVKTKLKHCCDVYKSEELMKKGFFGLGKPHKNFLHRVGDYTIVMKNKYGIYDKQIHQKKYSYHVGDHGGLTKEELYVPLIVIKK